MLRHAAVRGSLACAAVLLLAAPAARAALKDHGGAIYLKDGTVIKGFVMQPAETIIDPIGQQPITIHQGLFLVDDLCRRFFFSHAFVDRAEKRDFDYGRLIEFKRSTSFPEGKSLPPIRAVLDVGDWSAAWDRSYEFRSPRGTVKLSQHLGILTPHYARVNANCLDPVTLRDENPFPWTSYYRTRELGPETVVTLLSQHKDFKDSDNLTEDQRSDRRFQIFNFLVQAGWMDAAEKQLERIRILFPGQKEKIETAAAGIQKLVAQDRWDEIKLASAAGRHAAAQKRLDAFALDKADDQTQAEVRALKARYENANTALTRAKALLAALPKDVVAGDDGALFAEAAAAISAELTLDHVLKKGDNEEGRLERFLTQADQAERFAKQKQPHLRPAELLSLAVTAWVLGAPSAETKPETARKLWQARRFARQYQKAADAADRAALLKEYEGKDPISVAEMAQLIGNLPPADPPEKTSSAEVEMKAFGGKGQSYRLKLPPEYHVGRPYPVLIALHHGGEAGKDMVKRWEEHAARYGYILACPDWDQGIGGYAYSPVEHATVLDTLRDLRQRFNVDSDRVFLTGYGEGGNMAWDVGLSHPDLFAGVIPVCGQPRAQAIAYWPNAMELPFYAVWGERMGGPGGAEDQPKTNANVVIYNMFKENWIRRGVPALGVQYKGRGLEWFAAEVPDYFQWMAPKRRRNPMKVGYKDIVNDKGDVSEYRDSLRSLRESDNQFYWVTLEGIVPRRGEAATVAAKIVNGNQIAVSSGGVKRVTLLLGRGMIDFDKPVSVNYNLGQKMMNKVVVKPSLDVLLKDFYERGDRQRLYLARLEVR